MTQAYPLQWPNGWKRSSYRQSARFADCSLARAANDVTHELQKLGAKSITISSNVSVTVNGNLKSNERNPDDSGVAVYFFRNGKEQCIPCDKWNKVAHNLWAIAKTVGALRGIERWGAKNMVDAAFRGFEALPDFSEGKKITQRYFDDCVDADQIKGRYIRLAKTLHPDSGGNAEDFQAMKEQYEQLKDKHD